ncbi:methyltransferase-UbiE family protein [Penicillium citrinum]|uniref:Methyltransferase-UbiE family protein n=1 Tax=Penicillium citrinum TaxID=5077 RepID=A0A9W9PAJ1_PENCI|nr:methyltransferase-UbiE family protein [Penicillium citrinum]KAJ5240976.1 methyltransferase-UbiE family protein [Penicillium citrinum]
MSKVYTTDHSASVIQTHGWRTLANSAAYVIPCIRPDLQILDVGCGPGSITIDLAKHAPQGHVIGIEYVPDPLDGARKLAASESVSNVTFQVGDIHNIPFPDDTFDLVHAHQVLQHIADPVRAFQEMRRVVKKGGVVAVRESASLTWYPESEGIAAWKELSERMGRAKGGNPHPGRMIHVWAHEAGFSREQIKKSTGSWCFSNQQEREYWGGSMEQRVQSSGFATTAIEEGFSSQGELDNIAAGWRAFVQDDNAWFGLLHGEVLCWK